ncbi:hypothetical protein ABID56_001723 [Alkalibacillus flavidus]|uniref:Uncharacterized protein n=1 Tax=Alkalibacillus flavidus TaxID=546021 RepID=A0ABV2KVJ8_9BACI
MKRSLIIALIASIALLVLIPFSYSHLNASSNQYQGAEQSEIANQPLQRTNLTIVQAESESIEATDIANVMNQFMDQLVQDTNDDYEVKQYDSLKALKDSFSDIAAPKVVNQFVDHYYAERDGKLYINPTETPPWFVEGESFEQTTTDEGHVVIEQTNTTELDGQYTIVIELQLKDNGQPYIMDIQYK